MKANTVDKLLALLLGFEEKSPGAISSLRLQLTKYIGKLTNKFSKRFSRPELRQAIKVQP